MNSPISLIEGSYDQRQVQAGRSGLVVIKDAAGYWRDVLAVGRAIEQVFNPVKMNYMTLGNWVPHLHTHVVPRYIDDPAPGGPIAWDAIFGDPVPDEKLARWATDLRAALGEPR